MLTIKQEFEKFKQGLRFEALREGKAEAIIEVLQARGIALGEEGRQLISRCTDPALLDVWLKRAAVAQGVDEVLRPIG